MMPRLLLRFPIALCALLCAASPFIPPAAAADRIIDQAIQESLRGARDTAQSQLRIEDLDDKARALYAEYRGVSLQNETLEAYVERLQQLIADQEKDVRQREADIAGVETFERELFPAMARMIDALDGFVNADLSFLTTERRRRVVRLHGLMSRSDVTASEKFRQVMEAYQVESEYGRTIEAYRGTLDEDAMQVVDFLRIGRNLLVYQTLDAAQTMMWDAIAGAWQPLDDDYRTEVRRALRIARRQAAPELLILPFSAPVELERLR